MKNLLLIVLIAILGWYAYQYYQDHQLKPKIAEETKQTTAPSTENFKIQKCVTSDGRVIYVDHFKDGKCKNVSTETTTLKIVHNEAGLPQSPNLSANPSDKAPQVQFQCDGRTHCSQMHSCAEAKYFLKNCPNVEMDGDHDGIPCEEQWCGH